MIFSLTLSHAFFAAPYPLTQQTSQLPKVCDISEHLIREPFSICLVSERIPSCCSAPVACIWFQQTCKAAVDPIFLTFSLLMFPSVLLFLFSFFVSLGWVAFFVSVSLSVAFVMWLGLRASLKCAQLLPFPLSLTRTQSWKLEKATRRSYLVHSGVLLRAVWISASGMSSLMTGFIWIHPVCETRLTRKRSTSG